MFDQKGPTDCWIWQLNPDDAPNKGAKMACNNPLCCNERHIVSKASPRETLSEVEQEIDEEHEKANLREILDAANVSYRKNATFQSLQDLVDGLQTDSLAE